VRKEALLEFAPAFIIGVTTHGTIDFINRPEGRDRVTTKEVGRGTGQGLAIAASTVRGRHAGELSFETMEGRGTTFFMRIPVAGVPAAPLILPKRATVLTLRNV
jgi:hypothetical protein